MTIPKETVHILYYLESFHSVFTFNIIITLLPTDFNIFFNNLFGISLSVTLNLFSDIFIKWHRYDYEFKCIRGPDVLQMHNNVLVN